MAAHKSLLIAVAVREEHKPIQKFLEKEPLALGRWSGVVDGYAIETFVTSMGMAPARRAAEAAIDPAIHGGVLVLGYCGGLSPRLKTGDAVVASKILANSARDASKNAVGLFKEISMETALCEALGRSLISEGLNYRSVPLVTQPRVLEKPAEKQVLFEASRAEAVDMESFEIADLAHARDLRSAVVKFVVDDHQTELPPFNEYLESDGKLDQLQVKRVLVNSPALALKLRQCMKGASAQMEKAVPAIVATVCRHWGIEPTGTVLARDGKSR